MPRSSQDKSLLQAALYGFQMEKEKIDAKIRELEAQLKGKKLPAAAPPKAAKRRGRRAMSDAARARIAAAQRKRWADFHKKQASAQGGD
jgi:cell division septum initiation protein DivIVA